MALVVTARAPVASPEAAAPHTVAEATGWQRIRRLAIAVGAVYALALIVDAAARAMPTADPLQTANLVAGGFAAGLTLAFCVGVWLTHRADTGLLLAATLAPVLAAVRAVGGAALVTLELSTLAEVLGVSLGLLVLGGLVWAAAGPRRAVRVPADAAVDLFRRVAEVTALVLFAVCVSGATVGAVGASWACRGTFPDCNGLGMLPFGRDPLADIQLYHRLLSYVALGLVGWLTIEAFRTQKRVTGLRRTATLLLVGTVLSAVVGAVAVSTEVPPLSEVVHTVATLLTWSLAIVLVATAHRPATLEVAVAGVLQPAAARRSSLAEKISAYVQLTKPRVMSLLLATTATAMVIAARGLPDLQTLVATLLGGALMSGGAGAINHYVDRDIDPLMGRTAWRPIPSGVIAPRHALWFGIALALLASAVFFVFVNPTALVLALLGLLGYVFIYTLWLKRSTPSNIVIGGAAGAIPPLVGWAAVTNEISSLTAWYLFAIIFFWTPPHFWALSLLIRQHYERAGVPMLPVVRGDAETRLQILLYSILLVVLTLVLSPFGMMGPIYFVAAAILGGLFIRDALRLRSEATPRAARRLYLYSILYLFALFTAMAVDRVIVHS